MNKQEILNEIKLARKHLDRLEELLKDVPPSPPKPSDPYRAEAVRVMELMNDILGSNFVTTADGHLKPIIARLRQGRTIEDFKAVIRHRKNEWATDPKMSVYLRPSTIFGNKFDGYLAAAQRNRLNRSYDEDELSAALLKQFMED